MVRNMNNKQKAFTLIELLIVIAIIGLLAAILFPVFAQAKEAAKKTTCLSNEKQFATACLLYTSDYDDWFPTRNFEYPAPNVYIENNWFNTVKSDYNTNPITNTYSGGLLDKYLKAFELTGCPSGRDLLNWDLWKFSDKTKGVMSYGYNSNSSNGIGGKNVSDVQEPSNTYLLGDCAQYFTVAYAAANGSVIPTDGVYSEWQATNSSSTGIMHGRHPGNKINVAWIDGHVKSVPLTFRDCESSPSNVSFGRTTAKFTANKIGWLCPAGLIAQSGSNASWATSIANDPHFVNYFMPKKVP